MRGLLILSIAATLAISGCTKARHLLHHGWTEEAATNPGTREFSLTDGSRALAFAGPKASVTSADWDSNISAFCRFRRCPLWASGATRFATTRLKSGRSLAVLADRTNYHIWWIMGDFTDERGMREEMVELARQFGSSGTVPQFHEIQLPVRQPQSFSFGSKRVILPTSWYAYSETVGAPPNLSTPFYICEAGSSSVSLLRMGVKQFERMKASYPRLNGEAMPVLDATRIDGQVLVAEGKSADSTLRGEIKAFLGRAKSAK